MYAKLIKGQLVPLRQPLIIGGLDTFTNDESVIRAQGWKPVLLSDPPMQDGFYATSEWTETEDVITQEWTLHEVAQPEEPQIEP